LRILLRPVALFLWMPNLDVRNPFCPNAVQPLLSTARDFNHPARVTQFDSDEKGQGENCRNNSPLIPMHTPRSRWMRSKNWVPNCTHSHSTSPTLVFGPLHAPHLSFHRRCQSCPLRLANSRTPILIFIMAAPADYYGGYHLPKDRKYVDIHTVPWTLLH